MTLVTPDTHVPNEIKAIFRERVEDNATLRNIKSNLYTYISEIYNPEETDEFKTKAFSGIKKQASDFFENKGDTGIPDTQLKQIFLTPLIDTVKNNNSSDTLKLSALDTINFIRWSDHCGLGRKPSFFASTVAETFKEIFNLDGASDTVKTASLQNLNKLGEESDLKDANIRKNIYSTKIQLALAALKDPKTAPELQKAAVGLDFKNVAFTEIPDFLDSYIPSLITLVETEQEGDNYLKNRISAITRLGKFTYDNTVREKYDSKINDAIANIASNTKNDPLLRIAAIDALSAKNNAEMLKNILLEKEVVAEVPPTEEKEPKKDKKLLKDVKYAAIDRATSTNATECAQILITLGLESEDEMLKSYAQMRADELLQRSGGNPDITAAFIVNSSFLAIKNDEKENTSKINNLQYWAKAHPTDIEGRELLITVIDKRHAEIWENKLAITGPVSPLVEIDFLFQARKALELKQS